MGNENSDAGHIKCTRGPQVSHPCIKQWRTRWTEMYTKDSYSAGI